MNKSLKAFALAAALTCGVASSTPTTASEMSGTEMFAWTEAVPIMTTNDVRLLKTAIAALIATSLISGYYFVQELKLPKSTEDNITIEILRRKIKLRYWDNMASSAGSLIGLCTACWGAYKFITCASETIDRKDKMIFALVDALADALKIP